MEENLKLMNFNVGSTVFHHYFFWFQLMPCINTVLFPDEVTGFFK
jgi:hypothetical protein